MLLLAFLPPMSGLASNETRLDEGAVNVRIGEGEEQLKSYEIFAIKCLRKPKHGIDYLIRFLCYLVCDLIRQNI